MTISKRAGSLFVTGAALAGVLALSAGSALASTDAATWTATPGGTITAKAGTTTLKDTKTGTSSAVRKGAQIFQNRGRAHQRRLTALVQPLDFIGCREIFFFFGAVDDVRILWRSSGRLVGITRTSSR